MTPTVRREGNVLKVTVPGYGGSELVTYLTPREAEILMTALQQECEDMEREARGMRIDTAVRSFQDGLIEGLKS